MHPPFAPVPPSLQTVYQKLRITLFFFFILSGMTLAYTFLFPTITVSFDFRNPNSSKNQIFDPRSSEGAPRTNGKITPNEHLIAHTSPLGDFSNASIHLTLEKKSATPDSLNIAIKRNYRAFLFPIGSPMDGFPTPELFRIEDTYYELQDGQLFPFVSEAAFLSRFPQSAAKIESTMWSEQYPVSSQFRGFRVGSLVSFADGIFIITSEEEIRPIGSAEIFLAFGFHFADVIPGSEEDLGIYRRGRIFLMGAPHPDGTLFQDQSTNEYFLIDSGFRRPVPSGAYLDFLLTRIHPILALPSPSSMEARCTAEAGLLPRALDCTADLTALTDAIGSDYEITLSGSELPIDIATLTLDFDTRLDAKNGALLLAKVKQRILTRFGRP